jgi:hypothetical protein
MLTWIRNLFRKSRKHEWTSEGAGWIIFLNPPKDAVESTEQYYAARLEELATQIGGSLRITSRNTELGTMVVAGPYNTCVMLKDCVEGAGLATMDKNIAMHVVYE